jgi:short-subunit dehydrogenase
VCLVTGASSGIGRASAELLARQGAWVIALGRDRQALDRVAAATGGRAIQADLSKPDDVDRAAAEAGPVDVLVNNAGEGWFGSFADMDPNRAEELIRTNLLGPVRLTRALLPGMLERGRGAIVNVASIAGHVGVRHEAVYAATKAGLIAFSESLRQELTGTPVRVSVVSPGVVDTAFFERQGQPYHRRWPRLISSDRVAAAVVRAIRTGKPEVYVPRWVAFPAWLRGVWPWAYRKGADRFG